MTIFGVPAYNPQNNAPQPGQDSGGCCCECYSDSIGDKALIKNPVAVPINPVQLCNANPTRKELILVNTSLDTVYVGLGSAPQPGDTTSPIVYAFALTPCQSSADDGTGGIWVSDIWQGAIFLSSLAGTGVVNFTELV